MASRRRNNLIGLLLLGLAGCKGLFGPPALPDDPMFSNRKPVEAKAKIEPPIHLANSQPTMPEIPPDTYTAKHAERKRGLPPPQAPGMPTRLPSGPEALRPE